MIFSVQQSYILYFSAIIFSLLMSACSDFFTKKTSATKLSSSFAFSFILLAFLPLVLVSGLRFQIGVDYDSYLRIYNNIKTLGFFGYYESGNFLEPGYLLLQYFLGGLGVKDEWLFLVNASLGSFFLANSFFLLRKKSSITLMMFIYAFGFYFYFLGIERLFLAIAISYFGVSLYVSGKFWHYLIATVIAATFHVSALVMLSLVLLSVAWRKGGVLSFRNPNNKLFFKKYWSRFFWIVLLFLGFVFFLYAFSGALPSRYSGYFSGDLNLPVSTLAMRLPLYVAALYFLKRISLFNPEFSGLFFLFLVGIPLTFIASLVGLGRVLWYFQFVGIYLFPIIFCASNRSNFNYVLIFFVFLYYFIYSFYAYLLPINPEFRFLNIFPYQTFL